MEVEFIIPKSIFNVGEFQRLNAARATALALSIKRDYESTVKSWNRKPVFVVEHSKDSITVGTDDINYKGVEDGVPAHGIDVISNVMRFPVGYKAKTSPGVIGSRGGGKFGKIVVAKHVNHPGIQARKFTDAIKQKHDAIFFRDADDTISIANK